MGQLVSAVTQLRATLGESQQAFANRLGLSFRAVANYEKDRRPTGRVLYQLANLAHEHGREDLAKVFAGAFSEEVNAPVEPTTAEERLWVRALLAILRRRDELPTWKPLSEAILTSLRTLADRASAEERKDFEALLVQTTLYVEGSVLRLLESMSEQRMRTTGESKERAYFEILQQHPDLYVKYQQERVEAAKGTHAESTMVSPTDLVARRKQKLKSRRKAK